MVAVKSHLIDQTLKRLNPAIRVVLLYGPDSGLVEERARHAVKQSVTDVDDPFQLVRLEGDVLASDPGQLSDEISTIGLFGGNRVVWIKATSRNIAPSLTAVLDLDQPHSLVVIEAGDLAKTNPVRVLCEKDAKALACPCYEDEAQAVSLLIDKVLLEQGHTITSDARHFLIEHLGGNRLVTRAELTKLSTYLGSQTSITLEDIEAILSDVSGLVIDEVIDAAFLKDPSRLDERLARLIQEGTSAHALLSAAIRHAIGLLALRVQMDRGQSADEATSGWRGLYFRRKPLVIKQLSLWTTKNLQNMVQNLQDAMLLSRKQANLGTNIAAERLMQLKE